MRSLWRSMRMRSRSGVFSAVSAVHDWLKVAGQGRAGESNARLFDSALPRRRCVGVRCRWCQQVFCADRREQVQSVQLLVRTMMSAVCSAENARSGRGAGDRSTWSILTRTR